MNNALLSKKIAWAFCLIIACPFAMAQKAMPVVKGTKTDKTYANTTEIHKTEKATDDQVLAEVYDEYGLGDVIRISNAPPPTVVLPLSAFPSVIVSTKPNTISIILITTQPKPPSPVSVSTPALVDSEKPTISTTEKKGKSKKSVIRDEKIPEVKFISPKEKGVKKDEIANPAEKMTEETTASSLKNEEIGKRKIYSKVTEKKKEDHSLIQKANKQWMNDNLKAFNSNKKAHSVRTHRSSPTRFNGKKSGFLFFCKKNKTSSMPKQSKNNKKDRCYQF